MRLQAELLDKRDLTPREADVFTLLCSGLSDKAIAKELDIHIKVVSKNIDRVYEKLGLRWQSINTRCTAIGYGVASGMVRLVLNSVLLAVVLQSSMVETRSIVNKRPRVFSVAKSVREFA